MPDTQNRVLFSWPMNARNLFDFGLSSRGHSKVFYVICNQPYYIPLWHCSTYWVRTAGHFARFTPVSDFFYHTFCTLHTVHIVCSPFTLVVSPLLTTIVHHFFSAVLAEPHRGGPVLTNPIPVHLLYYGTCKATYWNTYTCLHLQLPTV